MATGLSARCRRRGYARARQAVEVVLQTPMRRLALAAALLVFAGPAQAAGGHLYIYTWTDYTAPELIKRFEAETGIAVTVDTYDSNETLLAKLKGGSADYDVVVITSDFVPIFIEQGLLRKIDAGGLPHFANVEARWRGPAWDPANAYTVPFHWGVTAYAYNTAKVPGALDSLTSLFDPPPEARGKIGMLGAASEVMSLAEIDLGLAPCQTETAAMKKVDALLEAQRPSVEVYNSDGIIERLASGEALMHQVWNGDAARARALNPAIRFVFPKEGVSGWMDNFAVPKDARDIDNARLFLDFMLRPENIGVSSNFTHYANAITGSDSTCDASWSGRVELKLPPGLRIVFTPSCPAPALRLIDKVWTRLRR